MPTFPMRNRAPVAEPPAFGLCGRRASQTPLAAYQDTDNLRGVLGTPLPLNTVLSITINTLSFMLVTKITPD